MLHALTHRHSAFTGPSGELEVCSWRGTRITRKVLYRPYPYSRPYSLSLAQLRAVMAARTPEQAMALLRTQSGS